MAAAALATGVSQAAGAQDTLPPSQGGYVHSLGLPELYKPYTGLGIGLSRGRGSHLASQWRLGTFRDIGNPITQLVGWAVEGYVGFRDVRADGGVRALLVSNLFRVGVGVDYDLRDGAGDVLLAYASPVRRGGIIGGGSELRVEWLPSRGQSFNVAINIPLKQPHRGRTRPPRPYVVLHAERPRDIAFALTDSALVRALDDVRESAHWINRFSVPKLGAPSGDATRVIAAAFAPLKARLADRTVDAEIRAYHAALARAFSAAVSDAPLPPGSETPLGAAVAAQAKAILLERVLFPYNRLIGQTKREDTSREFGGHARGVFARWLLTASAVRPERTEAALFVLQRLLDVVEEIRAYNAQAWGDSRLVWLPLQLALAPEQYDEQQELDSLIGRATGQQIRHGNRIWYVHNDRFQLELVKSIGRAEDYHVLWIHDFAGLNDSGQPDRLSLLVVTQAYLAALAERVARYDSTGRLPAYMIFLDQHYFEVNRSRLLLNFLQDPLGRQLALPQRFDSLGRAMTEAQERLRRAVAGSRLLQAERAQYGERWLHRVVKVHVNITNPSDPSFRSRQILPLIGMPDDAMRDHRKVVLYDVSEADPYRGMAMYAGMGVGEHYAGPSWEDRAIMVQGPATLTLRDEARQLLETQGIQGGEVPHVLRPRPKAPNYDARIHAEIDSMDAWGGVASRAVELHNGTGFAFKEISTAEATLFNLLSPGGVVKVPDSLWLNELLASLLVGSALRGVRVLVIAPSLASAPAAAWPNMAVAHDLLARLVAARQVLAPELLRGGGLLRAGLYDPDVDVDDLRDRVQLLRRRLAQDSVLRALYAFDAAFYQVLDSAETLLGASGGDHSPPAPPSARGKPKLHFKGFLYVSRDAWTHLISGAPMALGMREYLAQRARQLRERAAVGEDVMADAMQQVGALTINPVLDTLAPGARLRWVFFLQVGSPNQDYRSMTMDGEAAVLVSGWTSLYALPDFVLLTGLTTWLDDQAELDRRLPAPSGLKRRLAHWAKMAL